MYLKAVVECVVKLVWYGPPPHKSGCVSMVFFALLSSSSLWFFFRKFCLLFLCMRCASASSNGGLLDVLLYVSCSLSSLGFSIVQMRVPSGLCSVMCDGFVWCWVSSYLLVGCISSSGLIGVVKNVRLVDLHP